MKIVGSYNNLPLSVLTRKVLNEEASHIAFIWDDKWLIHSTLNGGVKPEWLNTWLKKNKIAWSLDIPLSLEKEEEVFQALLNSIGHEQYDVFGLLYWFYRGFLNLLFKTPWPKSNRWHSPSMKLCVGIVTELPEWLVGKLPPESELEMTSPDKLGQIIAKNLMEKGAST